MAALAATAALLAAACSGQAEAPAAPPPPPLPASFSATLRAATYLGSGVSAHRTANFDAEGNLVTAGGALTSPDWKADRRYGEPGGFDVFVVKLSPDGQPIWTVILGGPEEDYAYVSAIDASGNIYVGGRAGVGFPVTPGAFQTKFAGGVGRGPHDPSDAFVLKLSPDGELLWATYMGGSGDEITRAISLLPSGKLAVGGGDVTSKDLPTDRGVLPGPVLKPHLGGYRDSWIGVIHPDGKAFDFITYFGPDDEPTDRSDEIVRGLGVDPDGNLWVGGSTSGSDMVATPDAFQKQRPGTGGSNAYVARISPDGRRLVYFSWLGGSSNEGIETEGNSDAKGSFYVAGFTGSPDFPITAGSNQRQVKGRMEDLPPAGDGFVARVDPDGSLGFSTIYGGSVPGPESFFGPVIDPEGNVYVTGRFRSPDCQMTTGAVQPHHAGKPGVHDAVLVILDPEGSLRYATWYGGSGGEHARHLAYDPVHHRVALAGETNSKDLPLKNPAQTDPSGAFVVIYDVAPVAP